MGKIQLDKEGARSRREEQQIHGDRKVSGILGEHKEARVGLSSRRAVGSEVQRQARVCWERPRTE